MMTDSSEKDTETSRIIKVPPPSSALTAVAFQDHISRQLSLSLADPIGSPRKPGCRTCGKTVRTQHKSKTQCNLRNAAAPCHSGAAKSPNSYDKQTNNGSPHLTSAVQASDGHRNALHTVKVATSSTKLVHRCPNRPEVEYVLDPRPPPLTLAQKLGLVEAPHPLLTERHWVQVKAASNARQDFSLPCPICQEDFGLREQVLLSCSHVFHRACLCSLERHSHRKCCPLCRREGYQTRVIFEAAAHYRTTAATKIQAMWRGYVTRRWYRDLRQRVPPRDPSLRQRYFAEKFSVLTDHVVQSCECSASGAERVLAEADTALADARDVMRVFDLHTQLIHFPINWAEVSRKALEHVTTDCPVCLIPLLPSPFPRPPRPLSLLSCGHLLHAACIDALEQYSASSPPLCPLCRAPYERQPFTHKPQ